MIEQNIQMTVKPVVCDFGDGDISISVVRNHDKVSIRFGVLENKQEIGSTVDKMEIHKDAIVMDFDNIHSLETLKTIVEKAIGIMKANIALKKMKEEKTFVVPFKGIHSRGVFQIPSPIQIMTCMKHYQKTGNVDKKIVVSDKMRLMDGYVSWLVLDNEGVEKTEVIAPNGITMEISDKVVNFKSDKMLISYGMIYKEAIGDAFYLVVNNCGERHEFLAATPDDAVDIIKKINNVFYANYTIAKHSTFNTGLTAKMDEVGIPYTYKE